MTYYVLTAHHKSSDWVQPQTLALREFLPRDNELVASLEGVAERCSGSFDRVVPSLGHHAGKLNLLADRVTLHASPDDVLIFIDGDAFPIAPLSAWIEETLAVKPLAAVVRTENGDRQPHPSFTFTTCGFWRRIGGDWSSGYPWVNTLVQESVSDVGGNLMYVLESAATSWERIDRTGSLTDHPVFYGVYGQRVYHHGAGFRARLIRSDVANSDHGSNLDEGLIARERAEAERSRQIFDDLPQRWPFLVPASRR